MSTEETLLNLDFDKPHTTIALPDDGVVSLSSSAEEICLVPDIGFEGNVDSPVILARCTHGLLLHPSAGGRDDTPPLFPPNQVLIKLDDQRKAKCESLSCDSIEAGGVVCALNMRTGHSVSFVNSCDAKKHNCMFQTAFKVIYRGLCPWQKQSRRMNMPRIDYSESKYYNDVEEF